MDMLSMLEFLTGIVNIGGGGVNTTVGAGGGLP